MKGISSVLTSIILLLICIAVMGFAFSFFSKTTEQAQNTAVQQAELQKQQYSTTFQIENIDANAVYIRNTGTQPLTNILFIVNDVSIDYTGPEQLSPDSVGIYYLNNAQLSAIPDLESATLRVSSSGWSTEVTVQISAGVIIFNGPPKCYDSDSEMYPTQNYNLKGTIIVNNETKEDICSDNNVLIEYYCQGRDSEVFSQNAYTCPFGCSDGECISQATGSLEISDVYATEKTTNSIVIKWTTNTQSNSTVKYGTSQDVLNLRKDSSELVTDHSMILSPLTENTTYYILINSSDASGNTAEVGKYSFITNSTAPETPAVCSDTDSQLYMKAVYNVSGTVTFDEISFSDTCIDENTILEYYCSSSNSVANSTAFCSCTNGFCSGPAITDVYAYGKTDTSINVHWTTDRAADSVVKYGFTSGEYDSMEINSSLSIEHLISLHNLAVNTTYFLVLNSSDNASSSATDEFYFTSDEPPANSSGLYLDDLLAASLSPDVPISSGCADDFYNCRLMQEITKTHRFLQRNENGLPYADDPRNLTPEYEKIRLIVDTQAHGYLNLYKLTNHSAFLQEAETRLDYMLQHNSAILNYNSFYGQTGYTFLTAYEFNHKPEYLEMGLNTSNLCIKWPYADKVNNWGLMCAMNLAKAYKVTGNETYRNEERKFVRNTISQQHQDGSFSHQIDAGPNTQYTTWMVYELNMVRLDDPQNPDIDAALIKANEFLRARVNTQQIFLQSIYGYNYKDNLGTYYYELGGAETRGFTSELATVPFDLIVLGENQKSTIILKFLFSKENTDTNSGSYPDKWAYPQDSIWANSNSSIVRTSLIFWFLTSLPLVDNSCVNGQASACTISPADCNSAFSELNLCNSGISGTNTCINGRLTGCLNSSVIYYNTSSFECSIFRDDCADVYHFDGYKKQVLASYTSCFFGDCTPTPADHEYRCDQDTLCRCHPEQCP